MRLRILFEFQKVLVIGNDQRLKNKDTVTTSQIRIMHILSDKDKRVRPLEILSGGLDRAVFSQVLCYLSGDDNKHAELESWGKDVISLHISKKKLRRFQPSVVFQLARIINERGINIVHCQRHKPTVYGTLAAYMTGKNLKVISHVHGLNRTRSFRRKLLNRALFRRISRIIAVSNAVREDIIGTNWMSYPDKVVTIYNGIDVKPYIDYNLNREEAQIRLDLPHNEIFVFGTVGRLVETKGLGVLLKAFANVYEKCPESRLILAGEGRLESQLRALASELNISERVMFLGYRTDILEVLKAFDVFVFPSIAEGLPLALLEAMASGLPVIASRVGGVPEILNSPELRTMVSPGSVDELVSAMKDLYGMPEEERHEIGRALRERVLEEFSQEKMISAMTAEYLSVMNIHGAKEARL
jgi:glycosyltransferase involved in cell wall biosynthesis